MPLSKGGGASKKLRTDETLYVSLVGCFFGYIIPLGPIQEIECHQYVKIICIKMTHELDKAKRIYDGLQSDIQIHFLAEYIEPQLRGDDLVKEFHELLESEECQRLNYNELIDPIQKIIAHPAALVQMCKLDTLGFRGVYNQHFIQGRNTFVRVSCPYTSMCMEFVMRKWH